MEFRGLSKQEVEESRKKKWNKCVDAITARSVVEKDSGGI